MSGFLSEHSTVTAMLKVLDDIRLEMDRGKVGILVQLITEALRLLATRFLPVNI